MESDYMKKQGNDTHRYSGHFSGLNLLKEKKEGGRKGKRKELISALYVAEL